MDKENSTKKSASKSITDTEKSKKKATESHKKDTASKSIQKTKSKSKTLEESPEEKVKRPLNPYILFCKDERPAVTKDGFTGQDIMKELGRRWEDLGSKEKAKYQDEFEKNKGELTKSKRKGDVSESKSKSKSKKRSHKESTKCYADCQARCKSNLGF